MKVILGIDYKIHALQTKLISYGVEVTTLDNYYTIDFSTSF